MPKFEVGDVVRLDRRDSLDPWWDPSESQKRFVITATARIGKTFVHALDPPPKYNLARSRDVPNNVKWLDMKYISTTDIWEGWLVRDEFLTAARRAKMAQEKSAKSP